MRMGNHLRPRPVSLDEMAASNHSVGIAHPTVVPKNAAAVTGEDEEDAEADADADAEEAESMDGGA